MGSVALPCACFSGFSLVLCFCPGQLILLSTYLGNLLLVSYLHTPSLWIYYCFISLCFPGALQIASWGFGVFWQMAASEMVEQPKGLIISQALQLIYQHTTWNRTVSQAGKGIAAEANQPVIALWHWQEKNARHISCSQRLLKQQSLVPIPPWHNLRKERCSRVPRSQLRGSFQNGVVCSVFGKHWGIFYFSLYKALTILWIMWCGICITSYFWNLGAGIEVNLVIVPQNFTSKGAMVILFGPAAP